MLSTDQVTPLVENINKRANDILRAGGNDEELLVSLHDIMSDIMKVMKASTEHKLNWYCQKYDGFYRYMHLLDQLAKGISDGTISVPK